MKIGGSTAWRSITQPISDRSLFGVITGLRHVDLAHRYLRAISTWQSSHLSALRHGDPAHRYFRGIPAWRDHPPTDLKTVSFRCHNRSSARRPCPQVLQSHLRVAKQSSIGPSARPPRPEVSQSHRRVAKRSSIRHSARQTCPQVPQRHHPVAVSNRSFTSACP